MSEVPMVATPIGELELGAVLRDGHIHQFGEPPTQACVATAWAQCALEHAHGRAVYCHNLGNITAFGGWPGDYYVLRVKEQLKPGQWTPVNMKFRAHDDFIDGSWDYWHLLATTYASALPFFDVGDPAGAAHALKMKGYYTANEAPYAAAMKALHDYALTRVIPQIT